MVPLALYNLRGIFMATIHNLVVVSLDETAGNVERDLIAETGYSMLAGLKLKDFFKKIISGAHPATVQTKVNAVKATGTITFSGLVADDTFTIAGQTFTAKVSPSGGAQFALGADDTAAAANAVVKINANTTLDGRIVATSALGVITLTALLPGEAANSTAIAISAHGSVSGSGYMSGGTNGATERSHTYGSL